MSHKVVYDSPEAYVESFRTKIAEYAQLAENLIQKHKVYESLNSDFARLTTKYCTIVAVREDDEPFSLDVLQTICKNYFLTFLFFYDLIQNHQTGKILSEHENIRCKHFIHPTKINDFIEEGYPGPLKNHLSKLSIEGVCHEQRCIRNEFINASKVSMRLN